MAKEKQKQMMVNVLMNGRMYTMSFASYSSQFDSYLPIIEKMIDSFAPYKIQNLADTNNVERMSKNSVPLIDGSLNQDKQHNTKLGDDQNIIENIKWKKYVNPQYGYGINYPSNLGIGKPLPKEKYNSNLTGILFDISNSSSLTPEPKEGVSLSANSIQIGESKKKFSLAGFPYKQLLKNFDLEYLVLSANKTLAPFKTFPNFILLENKTMDFKNNTAYTTEFCFFSLNIEISCMKKWFMLQMAKIW